jgi:predicted nucleotide-binding protein (sugar kinase/HSP70/actin superfamily)
VKVTGYGEGFLQAALNADSGVVETIAHLRAARQFRPELDFVLDIGGQDIKCMRVRDGAVDDIMLNESCSSGCGALIEGFSRSLGFTKWSFASCALEAARPADLGTRCTVFMTSRVRHAQKEGVSAADIAAGLAYSVVRNALYKVIGCTDPSTLGEHVVVQGGTFKSDAVLRAFELESGLEVVRPDIAELMGAYGAALLARDECAAEDSDDLHLGSTLLTPLELASLSRQQTARRCQGCVNNCLLTLNTFVSSEAVECAAGAPLAARAGQAERSFVTGNRCERAVAGAGMSRSQPNLFEYERRLLFAYDRRSEEAKSSACGLTIGIPGVLDLYETYPFWWAFFTELGLNVIRIPASRSDVYRKGAHAVMSEGVCYPAKLAHGHVLHLIERGADLIFMPTGGAVASSRKGVCEAGCSRMIECPVSSNYARIVAEGVAELDAPVRFLTCDLGSTVPLARQLREALENAGLAASLCLDDERLHQAFAAATREQGVFYERLADQSAEVLRGLDENDTRGIVLAGHPYHVDAGISHGVDSLLAGLGFPVLSAAGLLALRHRGGFPTAAGAASGEGNCRAHALGGPELPVSDCPDITGARGVSAAALAPVDVDAIAATWTQPAALYELARMVAGRERLDLVQLYSFGCGVDALSTGQVRAILEDAGKLYTALKMDEMVDLAAIRIRLRSLIAALQARRQRPSLRRSTPDCVKSPPSVIAPLVIMPALMPQHLAAVRRVVGEAGYRLEILPELSVDDVETGLRFCSNDLCHPLIALAGQVIGVLRDREETGPVTVMIPQVCYGCRAIELEHIIRGQLKGIPGSDDIGITGIPSRNELFTMPAWLATRIYDELAQVDAASASATAPTASVAAAPAASAAASAAVPTASAAAPATTAPASTAAPAASTTAPATTAPASTTSATAPATTAPASTTSATAPATVGSALTPVPQPRVGVVGNAGLLFTPRLNRDLLKRIEAQGCVPHTPPITELLTTNAPLERFVDSFVEQGILDIICVQSFGCLTGHIHGRGAAKRLKERHPELNVSFIDYDSGTSEVNQDNRLRLALTIARERTPTP